MHTLMYFLTTEFGEKARKRFIDCVTVFLRFLDPFDPFVFGKPHPCVTGGWGEVICKKFGVGFPVLGIFGLFYGPSRS